MKVQRDFLRAEVHRLMADNARLRAALNSVRTDVMQRRLRLPTETYAQVIAALADEQKVDTE